MQTDTSKTAPEKSVEDLYCPAEHLRLGNERVRVASLRGWVLSKVSHFYSPLFALFIHSTPFPSLTPQAATRSGYKYFFSLGSVQAKCISSFYVHIVFKWIKMILAYLILFFSLPSINTVFKIIYARV